MKICEIFRNYAIYDSVSTLIDPVGAGEAHPAVLRAHGVPERRVVNSDYSDHLYPDPERVKQRQKL